MSSQIVVRPTDRRSDLPECAVGERVGILRIGNDHYTAVRVRKDVVASACSLELVSVFFKRARKLASRDASLQTLTTTAVDSVSARMAAGGIGLPSSWSSSRTSWIASFIFSRASSSVYPQVRGARKFGTVHAKRFTSILELIRLYDDFENVTFQGTPPCSNDNVLRVSLMTSSLGTPTLILPEITTMGKLTGGHSST